jgi:hypothetical protein
MILGMSAPPAAFAAATSLQKMHDLLRPGGAWTVTNSKGRSLGFIRFYPCFFCLCTTGLLFVNVVARSDALLLQLRQDLHAIFCCDNSDSSSSSSSGGSDVGSRGRVVRLRPSDETLNVLVVAMRARAPEAAKKGAGKASGAGAAAEAPTAAQEKEKEKEMSRALLESWLEVRSL